MSYPASQRVRVLMNQLLDFHRRAAKPAWWSFFARQEMTPEELLEDPECIAGLSLLSVQNGPNGRSPQTARYTYPEQDFKLRSGDDCIRTDTFESLGKLGDIDEDARTLEIKISARKEAPASINISAGGPINTDVISKAVFRQADALLAAIAANSVDGTRAIKQGLCAVVAQDRAGLDQAARSFLDLFQGRDFTEGRDAFLQKRQADFPSHHKDAAT